MVCVRCQGSGKNQDETLCDACHGSGRIETVNSQSDRAEWKTEAEIVDRYESHGTTYIDVFETTFNTDREIVGQGYSEDIPVLPETPYVLMWTFVGSLYGAYTNEVDARQSLAQAVERYEATHDIWTADGFGLYYVPDADHVTVLFTEHLSGNLSPDQEKWGTPDEQSERGEKHQALLDATRLAPRSLSDLK